MTTSTTEVTPDVPGRAYDLIASIVSSNAEQAASITNHIIAMHKRNEVALAKALLDLIDGLDAIPEMQRTAYIDRLCATNSGVYLAERILAAATEGNEEQ